MDIQEYIDIFRKIFSFKQYALLLSQLKHKPYHTIAHGGVRAGKTTILVFQFLLHILSFRGRKLVKPPFFFVSGSTISTLNNNVVREINYLNEIFGFGLPNYHINQNNRTISVFGFDVTFYGASNSDSYEDLQGVSAAGWYANEIVLHHSNFTEKAFHRLDQPNSRVFWDCNPSAPDHIVKKNYIDRGVEFFSKELDYSSLEDYVRSFSSSHPKIVSYHFTIHDNSFLGEEEKDNIIRSSGGGQFYRRDILGEWIGAEGLVYSDFSVDRNGISFEELQQIKKEEKSYEYFVGGMDWGFKHNNVFTFVGVTKNGEYILLDEVAEVEKPIEFWIETVKKYLAKYGPFMIYCDSARPDYVDLFKNKISDKLIKEANKSVLEGISLLSSLIRERKFRVNLENCPLFFKEVYRYSWEVGKDSVVKSFDDCMDSLRYALYSDFKRKNSDRYGGVNLYSKAYGGGDVGTRSVLMENPYLKAYGG